MEHSYSVTVHSYYKLSTSDPCNQKQRTWKISVCVFHCDKSCTPGHIPGQKFKAKMIRYSLLLASFPGLPCFFLFVCLFCSSVCIQYNTRTQKRKSALLLPCIILNANRRTKKKRGRPGNEASLLVQVYLVSSPDPTLSRGETVW